VLMDRCSSLVFLLSPCSGKGRLCAPHTATSAE
jgi:hypothetical protein